MPLTHGCFLPCLDFPILRLHCPHALSQMSNRCCPAKHEALQELRPGFSRGLTPHEAPLPSTHPSTSQSCQPLPVPTWYQKGGEAKTRLSPLPPCPFACTSGSQTMCPPCLALSILAVEPQCPKEQGTMPGALQGAPRCAPRACLRQASPGHRSTRAGVAMSAVSVMLQIVCTRERWDSQAQHS